MIESEEKWKARQRKFAERVPRFKIDSCKLEPHKSGYQIIVDGIGLRPAISPMTVLVDGITETKFSFLPDGRQLKISLNRAPEIGDVELDFGYVIGKCQVDKG